MVLGMLYATFKDIRRHKDQSYVSQPIKLIKKPWYQFHVDHEFIWGEWMAVCGPDYNTCYDIIYEQFELPKDDRYIKNFLLFNTSIKIQPDAPGSFLLVKFVNPSSSAAFVLEYS